ncbi:uncharacterized protein [Oryza sativa Japonica Group]|uniref:Expressed protein n=2 Tax=Oryza sativa subsp. japonica TaxID=39947 RepID=Q10PB4_ORYSJ|nr:uncharacterized protein LOC4332202 [Oryza sativa Japonica Group]ABF94885.1 expressed protein [Oryza sativa Japonica Group]KAB8091007.1 hypothetical protein EE612_016400 [Oryza sativa]KAF2938258.1 hypothetical protein DAI22_03g105400 [Oryza sativa Japonica Group]BAS83186.1 Os03g0240400 [Oryza sativa Japonica Group]
MNLSDDWRFLFPVSSVFAPPSLATSSAAAASYGPLLFSPLPPHATLLALPSPFQPPHPSRRGLRHLLRHFVRSTSFLPFADLDPLSGALLTAPSPPFPAPSNLLAVLRAPSSSRSLVVFFPSGENAEQVSYVTLDPVADPTTPLSHSVQSDGFMHPRHRIQQLATTASWSSWPSRSRDSSIEGFLLAATLYSVNWFKVESRGSGSPALVPAAKQAFDAAVVHACWSKHLQSECVVLLENGQLCWFDLDTRRGGKMKVGFGSKDDLGDWLSCEYGAQPWTVIVASTAAILLVDMRFGDHGEYKVLARVGMEGLFETDPFVKTQCYLAFCKAPFDDFLISVVTERHLMVFDIRRPLIPVLAWQHGLDNPNHIAMFRLSELRPSKEHEWASNSGFAILVGSLWSTEFNLFFCGPKEQDATENAPLYAWDLPSRISLIGQHCSCSIGLMEEVFKGVVPGHGSASQLIRNYIIGYHVLPNTMLESSFTGFALIRLTSSGKLEMQRFRASGDLHDDAICDESQHKSVGSSSSISLDTHGENFSERYEFLKLHYLSKFLKGNLRSSLENHDSDVNKRSRHIIISEDVSVFAKDNSASCSQSVSDFLCNASAPMNIFEIACQSILSRLSSDILLVAFSKYKDMLASTNKKRIYEYLEVPACFPNSNKLRPYLLAKSSSISWNLTSKAKSGNSLVGPVLPIPVLLAMEDSNKGIDSPSREDSSSVSHRCREVIEAFVPEISIANTDNCNGWSASQEVKDDKPYFVYEPQTDRPTLDEAARKKDKQTQKLDDPSCLHAPTAPPMDENFMTFVCGRAGIPHSGPEQAASNLFDFSPVRMKFESPAIDIQPAEEKVYKCLKKQFLAWQNDFKPYQDFCNSYQIQKPPQ